MVAEADAACMREQLHPRVTMLELLDLEERTVTSAVMAGGAGRAAQTVSDG